MRKIVETEEDKEADEPPTPDDEEPETEVAPIATKQIPVLQQAPVQEEVDGEMVTRMKFVRQRQTVTVVPNSTVTTPQTLIEKFKIEDVECLDVDGTKIETEEIRNRLVEKAPVVIVNDAKSIDPYFGLLMKPDTIFIVQPTAEPLKNDDE